MRPLLIAMIIAMILPLGPVPVGAAEAGRGALVQIQWGGSAGGEAPSTGISPTPMPQTRPPGAAALESGRDPEGRWGPREKPDRDRRGKRDRPRFPRHPDRDFPRESRLPRQRPLLFLDDDDEERIVGPAAPAERDQPEAAAAPEPPARPDPRGPKFLPARGSAGGSAGKASYVVGEPLPEGVPFVTLDQSRYGLPELPPGLVYARVGGDVLLIDPASRRVESRVDPGKLETAGEERSRGGTEPE